MIECKKQCKDLCILTLLPTMTCVWRILQKRRDPAAFDERLMFEEVLAFRKPDA